MTPEELKSLNRQAFRNGNDYLKNEPWKTATDTLREIANVRNARLQDCIDAVFLHTFDELQGRSSATPSELLRVIRPAWVKHMALQCGLHFWPDANHRTAIVSFNGVLERLFGLNVFMDKDVATRMLTESKAVRPTMHHEGKLTFSALLDPKHPYAAAFWAAAPYLQLTAELGKRHGMLYNDAA
ncbi:MAG: hypothetical protein LC620_00425 [Halobacteriales archaeon]|nr:hypothetical protein [Halobacteriales archaeon]